MKKRVFQRWAMILILGLVVFTTKAQFVPQGVNYQGIARDAQGLPVANKEIVLELSILKGSSTGSIVYQETHVLTTNSMGLFNAVIGQGKSTYLSGTLAAFDQIKWDNDQYYIKVRVDFGSSSYLNGLVDMGTVQFLSVPYSILSDSTLHAPLPTLGEIMGFDPDTLRESASFIWDSVAQDWQTGSVFITTNGRTDLQDDWEIHDDDIHMYNGNIFADTAKFYSLRVHSGTKINYFSPAADLGGQVLSSNETLPTQRAVKTYVDDTVTAVKTYLQGLIGSGWIINATDIYNTSLDVGIGTNNPTEKFHAFIDTRNFLVEATYNSSNASPNFGAGTRMFFNGSKSAFRAGTVGGSGSNYWDNTLTGSFSAALGYNTRASGDYSFAIGNTSYASGTSSVAVGRENTTSGLYGFSGGYQCGASGQSSFSFGERCTTTVSSSIALGYFCTTNGSRSLTAGDNCQVLQTGSIALGSFSRTNANNGVAIGRYAISDSYAETTLGHFSASYTPNSTVAWDAADRLLVVGNGTGVAGPGQFNNALVLLKNGNLGINTNAPTSHMEVNGSMGMKAETISATTTLSGNNNIILANSTAGNIMLTLPPAANCSNRVYTIKKISAANTVTLDGNAAELIDGATTYVMSTQYVSVTIVSNGSQWYIVGSF